MRAQVLPHLAETAQVTVRASDFMVWAVSLALLLYLSVTLPLARIRCPPDCAVAPIWNEAAHPIIATEDEQALTRARALTRTPSIYTRCACVQDRFCEQLNLKPIRRFATHVSDKSYELNIVGG